MWSRRPALRNQRDQSNPFLASGKPAQHKAAAWIALRRRKLLFVPVHVVKYRWILVKAEKLRRNEEEA